MSSTQIFSIFILFFTVVLSTSSALPTFQSKITVVQVKQLCSHTPDPNLCFSVLTHDPRTSRADYLGVANIALDLSTSGVKSTLALLQWLVKQTPVRGPVKQRYQSCEVDYGNAMRALGAARAALGARNWRGFHDWAIDALNQVQNCEDEFDAPPPDKTRVVPLSKRNKGIIGIAVAVAGFL